MVDKKTLPLSRKNFLKKSVWGMAGVMLDPFGESNNSNIEILEAPNRERYFSPNDRIQVAVIGMGKIATQATPTALKVPGVELVAVADCYDSRLVHAKEAYGENIFTTKDYREILARSGVDAVIVSVPDHWHSRISIDAMKAGKAVYCEKPMIHEIKEGNKVIQTQKETGEIMQVGDQWASSIIFKKAGELYKSGAIGNVNQVVASYNRNSVLGAWQYSMPKGATPETVDWDTFLGPAPKRPWEPKRFFRWRQYQDYGEGIPGDLFVHLFTAVHTVLSAIGPTKISAAGGLRYWHDGREVPDVIMGEYSYPETDNHPGFTLLLQSNLADGGGSGTRFQFIGDEGIIEIGRNRNTLKLIKSPRRPPSLNTLVNSFNTIRTLSSKDQKEFKHNYKKEHANRVPNSSDMSRTMEFETPSGYNSRFDHFVNFFDSIRNGSFVFEDPVFGFRAAAPCLLTNKSYRENRLIQWNPTDMRVDR